MDFIELFQLCLFLLSGLYSYVLLPLAIFFGLRLIIKETIREIKKKE